MSEIRYTESQLAAIRHEEGSLLVSAAAGSGKTRVLVERLLRKIEDPTREVNIDDFLVITYTRAAAGELRAKILEELARRTAADPKNRHLRRQSTLCYRAKIGTIHSFCSDLIRENAHLLGISPDFRVADESESTLIKEAVLEAVLDRRYESEPEGSGFYALVDVLGAGRDDARLAETVLEAHGKLQSHPFPAQWIAAMLEKLDFTGATDAGQTVWGARILGDARRRAEYCAGVLQSLLAEAETHPDVQKAYGEGLRVTAQGLDGLLSGLDRGWDAACSAAGLVEFPRAKPLKGHDALKEIRKSCLDEIKKILGDLRFSSDVLLEDMEAVTPVVAELYGLILSFDSAYAEEKARRGLIDFSDQEHMAARLLYDSEAGGPTELARAVSRRYNEIMVDEYQDVNAVQELIFSSIAREDGNLFMVGDVKQSIYRFRLADPTIFLRKYHAFKDAGAEGDAPGTRVLLSSNFRSRRGVLDAVNFVFRNVMSQEFGEMDYTPREFLHAGRADAAAETPAVSLEILDMASLAEEEDEGEGVKKTEAEAEYIAARIDALISGGAAVPDGRGGERPAVYGDFTILLPAMKGKARQYADALRARGIPVSLPGGEGFFESFEITVLLSLLEIIDNPLQDIPLISVLRSPIYGFTDDALSQIRAGGEGPYFYDRLLAAAGENEQCAGFLAELADYRLVAPDLSSDRLIWLVLNRTGFPALAGAMEGGAARVRNLMTLAALASRFEENGYRGLFAFTSYMRQLAERGEDPGEGAAAGEGDAVQIMSIHKSKGLEFPFVFLADTAKRFNMMDLTRPVLFHAELGAGLKRRDLGRKIEYTTLQRMAVTAQLTAEALAEQLRVLYVAMTRARERLYIIMTFPDADKALCKLQKSAACPVPPVVMASARSFAEVILLPGLTRPEFAALDYGAFTSFTDFGEPWAIRIVPAPVPGGGGRVQDEAERCAPDPAVVAEIAENLAYVYPYAAAVDLSSKLTATALKGRLADFETAEDAPPPGTGRGTEGTPFDRPLFITESRALTGAERGTALHLVMQYIDFARCTDPGAVRDEIGRLLAAGQITAEQAAAVEPGRVAAFFTSPTGRRLLAADRLEREFKFSILLPAGELFPGAGEDEILFQGVVDCFYEEEGALTVVDFKTDFVTPETVSARAREYAPQVTAYARALEVITGKPVRRRLLYFFALGTETEI